MSDFVFPLIALVLDFLCLLMCVRHIFSKKGAAWIAPAFLSLVFLGGSAVCLFAEVYKQSPETIRTYARYLSDYQLGISVVWMVCIIVLWTTLNKVLAQYTKDFKNREEAEYLTQKTAPEEYWERMGNAKKAAASANSHKVKKPTRVNDPSLSFRNYYGEAVNTMSVKKTSFKNETNG